MNRKLLIVVTLLFLLPVVAFAQNGKVRGIVTDKKTGEPLPGANVMIEGTTLGASTDMNGVYVILAVPVGVVSVKATYIGYKQEIIENVRVNSNLTTTQDFELSQEAVKGEVVVVIGERPLIQRNTTNTVRMTTQEDIKNIPVRGMDNILALNAGVVLQDGVLHVRGGREREVAYFIDGATATIPYVQISTTGRGMQSQDPLSTANPNIEVIQEAIEEVQMQAGGYTAEFGGANSAVVRATMRGGGPTYKASMDYRTDDFVHSGNQFLNTSSFGYRNAVLTLSGPVPSVPKLRFFVAGQHNYMRNKTPTFVVPFKFEGLVDDGLGDSWGAATNWGERSREGDPLPGSVAYKENYLPGNYSKDNSVQGTLQYGVTDNIVMRLTGSYGDLRYSPQGGNFNSSIYNYFNLGRRPETIEKRILTSLRLTHLLNPTTFYELSLFYTKRSARTIDPVFGDEWKKYTDREANAAKGYGLTPETEWRSKYLGPPDYSTIYNFTMESPEAPVTQYEKNSQTDLGAALDFTTQLTKNWELKAGGRLDMWSMRRYNIRNIMSFMEYENGVDGTTPKTFASDYERWVMLGRTGGRLRPIIYGYDIDGKEYNEFPNGPRTPYFASFYIQNKLEYQDLIVNFGLRYERINIKAPKPKNDENPAFDTDLDWIDETQMVETEPFNYLLPRITFSFPVTDKTVFYALYGKYVQMPNLSSIYIGIPKLSHSVSPVTREPYGYFSEWVGYTAKPERTTQYEMGIRQSLSDNFAFTITGFYKDQRDLLRWDIVRATGEQTLAENAPIFSGRMNNDFGTVKGVELTLELRRTKRLATKVNYTFSETRGTGSDSRSSSVVVSDVMIARYPMFTNYLDFHQPHRGSVTVDYRFPKGDGGKILEGLGMNILLNFNSGHPYTKIREPQSLGQADSWNVGVRALSDPRDRKPEEALNSSFTPWNFNIDLNVDKVFYLGRLNVDVYVNVLNLLNTKNVINVYPMTGTAEDDGWLKCDLASAYYGISNYIDFYRAINMDNRYGYSQATGLDIYGIPRQIRVGVRLEFN